MLSQFVQSTAMRVEQLISSNREEEAKGGGKGKRFQCHAFVQSPD